MQVATSPWAWARAPAALAAALVVAVVTAGPAVATPEPPVPAAVLEVFAGEALRQATAGGAAVGADFSGARVEVVHTVHRFSLDFLEGQPTDQPVIAAEEWLGSLTRGEEVLGTVGVWTLDGGPAEPIGYSNDVAIGRALRTLTPTEILVVDEPTGTYFALDGTAVRPLNDWARKAVPAAADIAHLQDAMAEQHAALGEHADDIAALPPLTLALLGTALALLVGGGLVLLLRRRRSSVGSAWARREPS